MFDRAFLGTRLRQMREVRGYTSQQFARRINTSNTQISRIECGARSASVAWLEKFAEGCNLSMCELLDGLTNPTVDLLDDPFITEISKIMGVLTDVQRTVVLDVLKDLHDNRNRKH
jgi:transcriptional regulator with XRE-family HTH domain